MSTFLNMSGNSPPASRGYSMNISTQRKRKQVEVWHPKAHNLQLPHVPPEARQAIRKKLSPWLANLKDYDGQRVGVKVGDCWNIAQSLTLTAQDDTVQYVEGVWSDCQQHGWNLIDGYVVDLVDEFFIWQGREGERLREPLNVYTVVETCGVQALRRDTRHADNQCAVPVTIRFIQVASCRFGGHRQHETHMPVCRRKF